MGFKEDAAYCPQCGRQVLAKQETPSHILHLLLTIFTGGLWIIVWIAVSVRDRPWRCSQCGTDQVQIEDLSQQTRTCPKCGTVNKASFPQCTKCDANLTDVKSAEQPAQARYSFQAIPEAEPITASKTEIVVEASRSSQSHSQVIKNKIKSATKLCPACAEEIKLMAAKCRFCGENFDEELVKQQTREAYDQLASLFEDEPPCPDCGKKVNVTSHRTDSDVTIYYCTDCSRKFAPA